MSEWKLAGQVGVDSGQLMIVDPCYLSAYKDTEFVDIRLFKHVITGKYYAYATLEAKEYCRNKEIPCEFFENFERILSCGWKPNEYIAANKWEEVSIDHGDEFSYNTVSHTTIKERYGTIQNGLAFAFRSGFGDGCYDVYVKEKFGRVAEIKIVMIDEEEDEDYDDGDFPPPGLELHREK